MDGKLFTLSRAFRWNLLAFLLFYNIFLLHDWDDENKFGVHEMSVVLSDCLNK